MQLRAEFFFSCEDDGFYDRSRRLRFACCVCERLYGILFSSS